MNIISLDIETYGAARGNHIGLLLPEQTVFHPRKSEYIDQVNKEDLILTAAITLPKNPPTSTTLNFDLLAGLEPGSTMVFQLHDPVHRQMLDQWIRSADVILGMNLQFDIQYLKYYGFKFFDLTKLVDLSVLNYLHSELREERSLKALGPILGAYSYSETLKTVRYKRPTDQKLLQYNAQDTHNTMLAIIELSKRLREEKFDDHFDSLHGEYSLNFYSSSIWATIAMSEAGVPMSSLALQNLMGKCEQEIKAAEEDAKAYELILRGPGSATSKDTLLREIILLIESVSNPDIMNALDVTPKSKKVSFSDKNRTTLYEALPEGIDADMYRECLDAANKHGKAMKLMSSYCYPLLYHRRNKPDDMSSIIIPPGMKMGTHLTMEVPVYKTPADRVDAADKNLSDEKIRLMQGRFSDIKMPQMGDAIAYPTWYVTPSHIKNDTGSAGGTIQGRITCKQPSAQTFPKAVKSCIKSRYANGKIVAMDLSQAELRVAALLSGEFTMINAYERGRDLHAERARTLWGDYDEDATAQHQRRQVGKMMNFADLFLSSANTMRQQVYAQSGGDIDIPLAFYQNVVQDRSLVRPSLTQWQRGLLTKVRKDNRLILPLTGQSRTFLGDMGKSRSEIVNFPVQTTAGNVTLAIQHRLMRLLPEKIKMFLQIYDAIYLDCPADMEDAARDCIDKAVKFVAEEGYWSLLQHTYKNNVPLKHDVEVWD